MNSFSWALGRIVGWKIIYGSEYYFDYDETMWLIFMGSMSLTKIVPNIQIILINIEPK